MRDDLLDTDLSPTPTEPLRGAAPRNSERAPSTRGIAAAMSVVGAVMASGCTTAVVGIQDAGIYVTDAGVSDAPTAVSDAGLTVPDAGVSDAAEEDAPATR